jgi:AcrR family transcriptional regulator
MKKRNREESTQRILQAGLEVFSELGYDAATTKLIAQRAGLNESLLHRYFGNKEGLLGEINLLCIEAIKKQEPYPPEETPAEEIFSFMKSKVEQSGRTLNFMRVIISRVLVDSAFCEQLKNQVDLSLDIFFRERLSAFQQKGMIKPDVDLEVLFHSILSHTFAVGVMDRVLFKKSPEACLEQCRAFAKSLTEGICVNRH